MMVELFFFDFESGFINAALFMHPFFQDIFEA